MSVLYPLKFIPQPQYRIWGGNKFNQILPRESHMEGLGEIWSLSGVPGNLSRVENGYLKGTDLGEIMNKYGEHLFGPKAKAVFGNEFPLLIKFLDTAQPLSVQVHPNDELAKKLHGSSGKSEMWYVMEAEPDAELIVGFEEGITQNEYLKHLENGTVEGILHKVPVQKGDAVYIPAGRVHAIGKGVVLAEIQQTSDITYRIYDYNRVDKDGKKRELHTDLALQAIDFNPIEKIKTEYPKTGNEFTALIESPYFSSKIFKGDQSVQISQNDEFRIYVCTEGKAVIRSGNTDLELNTYESVLIPAELESFEIQPENNCGLIEVRAILPMP